VTASDGYDIEFGVDNRAANGAGDFFAAFHSETQMPVRVPHNYPRLELRALTGSGLFLDRCDFHNFVFE